MTNTVTVVVPADLISVNNNSLTLTLHLSLEENAASNTDHRYSFTYPWREQGRHHRPSVQFYLPMKVMKRVRQATQTIGTVLPTHEENEAGNTDYRYSFTYPWKSWREWGKHRRLWVQFYLPKKVTQLLQLLLDFFDDHLAVWKLQLARRSFLQSRPKHNRFWTMQASNYSFHHSWSLIQQLLSVFPEKGWTCLIR